MSKMGKIKNMFKSVRIIILLVFLVLAVVAINPAPSADGVAIRGIIKNSAAESAGIENPKPTMSPMSREIIHSMNKNIWMELFNHQELKPF